MLKRGISPGKGLTITPDGEFLDRRAGLNFMRAMAMEPKQRDAALLAHGLKGKLRAIAKIDRLPDAEVKVRLAICKPCPRRKERTDKKGQQKPAICELCWCNLSQKASDRAERCPAGLWPEPAATPPSQC